MIRFTDYFSATVLGTGNNNGISLEAGEYVFKSYYRLRTDGKDMYKLFFVNEVESTGNCRRGKKGDKYTVCEAYAAFSRDGEKEENPVKITFGKKETKTVEPGEIYESDRFEYTYNKDGYLVLCFKIKTEGRAFLPSTNESASTGRMFVNGKEEPCDNFVLRPAFVGVERPVKKTVGFFGDSITQGTRTENDKYEAWTHRIGNSLPADVSFWNLGMGWSRAYDAAGDGVFLKKAAMCDEVFVCFGVNDIRSGGRRADELWADLQSIRELLKKHNADITVRFLTVPPFNMSVYEEEQRRGVNALIRAEKECFDIAKCLEANSDGDVKEEYMANRCDAHPNGLGGKAVFEEFCIWREANGW